MINNRRCGNKGNQLSIFLCISFLVFSVSPVFSGDNISDMTEGIGKCADKEDKDNRIESYDNTISEKTGAPDHKISMMEKLWDLDEESRKNASMIQWYNPNYFLIAAYNTTPNKGTMLDVDPMAKAQNTEAVFQLSGKLRLLPDDYSLFNKLDVWLGYTQLSFWQLYNSAFSAPFRDTNYAPEGFITYRANYNIFDLNLVNLRIINGGFVHQSNGRCKPLSRSWNRLFTEFGFEKVFNTEQGKDRNEFDLFVKAWYRIPENNLEDDNPDIEKYLGYGEIRGVYYLDNFRFGLMLRNNFRTNNKGAIQLDFSLPMSFIPKFSDKVSFYVQYFNGYGENLLDYNSSSNRIGAGFMITDWGK